jgi:uncharacterized protein (DUF2225 family)
VHTEHSPDERGKYNTVYKYTENHWTGRNYRPEITFPSVNVFGKKCISNGARQRLTNMSNILQYKNIKKKFYEIGICHVAIFSGRNADVYAEEDMETRLS